MEVAGHDRPARARGPAAGAAGASARPRDPALRGAVDELRAWQRAGGLRTRRQPRRRLRARRRDPDHGRVVAAVGARAVPARARRRRRSTRSTAAVELDNAPNNHGDHLGSAYQDRLVRLRAQGPAHACSGARSGAATRASTAAAASSKRCRDGAAALAAAPRSRVAARRRSTRGDAVVRGRAKAATSGASTRSASARSAAPPSR